MGEYVYYLVVPLDGRVLFCFVFPPREIGGKVMMVEGKSYKDGGFEDEGG